ncbi:MAG: molybdopterin-dependent oxidoreductase, partial [Chloroflexi bacterium]|nr:molybdopterin-dependent oxidoreductase [Chloroflexota bacterium]
MKPRNPFRILLAVPHPALRETIAQVFRADRAEILVAASRDDLVSQVSANPDLLLAEPFAFDEPGLDLLRLLKRTAPAVPLIVLLPFDTPEYHRAAVRSGANGILSIQTLATDLVPTVEQILSRSTLVDGVAREIKRIAQTSAPIGDAAFDEDLSRLSLATLSGEAVERLAPRLPAFPSAISDTDVARPAQVGRVFLRGLSLASGPSSPHAVARTLRTACNVNCGSHFCGLDVSVREDRIVKIEPADFPDVRYRRICLKGMSYSQLIADPRRVVHPLKRVGARGEGNWQRVSWDQALDEIADKLREVAQEDGPRSWMFFPYSGQLAALNGMGGVYLRLAGALGASGTSLREYGVDSGIPSGLEETLGVGAGYGGNDFADLVNSRLILIWGGDPAQTRMNWWPFFLDAKRAGARLVTIDPRYSVSASKSDEWVAIRPGTDLYLALAMLRLTIEQRWFDREFVLRHTVAPLLVREDDGRFLRSSERSDPGSVGLVWDRHRQRAAAASESPALSGSFQVEGVACRTAFDRLREMLGPYSPAYVAQKTGLAADQIIALAQTYATTHPARILTMYGVDRWNHAATFGRLIATLAAFTGNLGVPGGGAGAESSGAGGFFNSKFDRPDGREYHAINPAVLPDQILTGKPYPIKAVWVAFGNWLNQWPDRNRLLNDVLPRLPLLVVADHFVTETARHADYVLPAAMFLEREDMVQGPGPYVQYQPAIVPPPAECRSDFEIAAGLARRLGCSEYFDRSSGEYLAEILSEDESTRALSFDELKRSGLLERELPLQARIPFHASRFRTSTGRVEFYVERLLPFGKALPDYEPPAEADPDGELIGRLPLVCITEHSRYRVHSTFVGAPWLPLIHAFPVRARRTVGRQLLLASWAAPLRAAGRFLTNGVVAVLF